VKSTDIRVKDFEYGFEDYRYRTPIKFGGVALDKVTILNVTMEVESNAGKRATGFGSVSRRCLQPGLCWKFTIVLPGIQFSSRP
jgi:hypothetical protein